mgnify:CR=1 FL=1
MSSKRIPQTTAHVRITRQSWQNGLLEGEVKAGEFEWQFRLHFREGELIIKTSRGRVLIKDPLSRILVQKYC